MAVAGQRYYSWDRRKAFFDAVAGGASMLEAVAVVGAARSVCRKWWAQSAGMPLSMGKAGGLALVPPADDGWVGDKLTALERDKIGTGLAAGASLSAIARELGRSVSTVSREVRRNAGPDGAYYGSVAHARAFARARRPKACKLDGRPGLQARIAGWLDDGWSPRLIAQVLRADAGGDHTAWVSHETIYQSLYLQARGHLRADLHKALSTGRAHRRPRGTARRPSAMLAGALTISERPAEAGDRAVPGHWEGDLIIGAANASAIGTLVERSTRFTILLHLPHDRTAETVATAMIAAMRDLPEHLRRSITWDRGSEMAAWRDIQVALDTQLFFCDPRSPWQRGTNENTNRLLRHWFAKGTDLSVHTAEDLRRVQSKLNSRPRPTLDLRTPAQALAELLEPKAA